MREAVRRYLLASALDTNVDKAAAAREFDALKQLARTMPEPSATLLRYVNDRDVVHLGPRLLPFIGLSAGDTALSVSKSPKPTVPIFLLHGIEDNVIPLIESENGMLPFVFWRMWCIDGPIIASMRRHALTR